MATAMAAQVEQHASLLMASREATDAVAIAEEENGSLRAICEQLRAVGTPGGVSNDNIMKPGSLHSGWHSQADGSVGEDTTTAEAVADALRDAASAATIGSSISLNDEVRKNELRVTRARTATAESRELLTNARAGAQHLLMLLAALRAAAGAPPTRPVTPSSLARRLISAATMLRAVATRVKAYEAADTDTETPKLTPTFAPTSPSPRALAELGLAMPEAKALFVPRVVASLSAQRRRSFASIHPRAAFYEGRIDDVEWGPGTAAFGATSVTPVPDVMLEVSARPSGLGKPSTALLSTHSSVTTTTTDTFTMASAIPPSSLPGFSRDIVRDPSRPALAERLRSRILDSAGAFIENAGVSRFDNAQTLLFNALGAPQQRPVSAPHQFFKGERSIVAQRVDDEAAFAYAQRRTLKKASAIARVSVLEAESRAMIATSVASIATAAADAAVVPRHSRSIRNQQSRRSAGTEAAARSSTLNLLAKDLGKPTLATVAPTATSPSRINNYPTKAWHVGA
jgi:hypothetical protein